jgi:hypothetical protein
MDRTRRSEGGRRVIIAIRRGTAALLLLAGGAIAGCSSSDGPARLCPDVSILAAANRVVLFRTGTGRDIIDVIAEAEIGNLRATCEFDDGAVDVEATFDIVATRGPVVSTEEIRFEYFAAVVGPDDRVLAKRVFSSDVRFVEGARRVGATEQTAQRIPLGSPDVPASRYQVLVGFQLTPDQLEYNRGQRR